MGLLLLLGGLALAVGAGVFYYHESDSPPPPRRRRGGGMLSKLDHDPSKPEEYSALREPWYEALGLETRDPRDDPEHIRRREDRDDVVRLEDFDIR